MEEYKVYTLKQVAAAIKQRIDEATGHAAFWIRAEIATINQNRHAYLELVEHQGGIRVAVMRGVIWESSLQAIQQQLGTEGPNILKSGVEILFRARANFHLVHGLSLSIEAIDPGFNLGAMERRKQEAIVALKKEGLFHLQRFVHMPPVVQRIALVASPGTAAYADFMKHLEENEHGYRFHVRLFRSSVQGDGAAANLRMALSAINPARFDAVVVVRGGGSKLDLEPFNDLELARIAARLPIPLLTGIGHDVDISVLDLVAHTPHKTPTAVADFLVDRSLYFETALGGMLVQAHNHLLTVFSAQHELLGSHAETIQLRPVIRYQAERGNLNNMAHQLNRQVAGQLTAKRKELDAHAQLLATAPVQKLTLVEAARIREHKTTLAAAARRGSQELLARLETMRQAVHLLHPDRLLERGFSITRKGGHALLNLDGVKPGDEIETSHHGGRTWSTINRIERHGN